MANLTKDVGATGLTTWGGQIRDDFLDKWNGQNKVKIVDEMLRNSSGVASLRLAIEMPVRAVKWSFASDRGEDDPRVALLDEARANMTTSWNDHIIDALLFVFYGWSMFSVTYERVNGRMLWRKFKALGHDTVQHWLFSDDGGLAGLQQWPHLEPMPIPIERMILYRLRKPKGSPEGESILRPAYPSWHYLKNLQQIEAIGIERNLNGLPMVHPPMAADMSEGSTDRETAEAIVRNVRNDEQAGIVLPAPTGDGEHQRWSFTLLSSGGASKVADTNMVISRYSRGIATAALASFLMLGQDGVGSLALSKDQTDFFTMSVNAVCDIIAETFTKYAIPRLLALNGFDADGVKMEHSPAGDVDLEGLGDFLQKTSSLLTWTPQDEEWLRGAARMPEMSAKTIAEEQARKRTAPVASAPTPVAQMRARSIEEYFGWRA